METATIVRNAGLVLTNPYLKMLFERLGFLENDVIKPSNQDQAVLYLNYLAYGSISNTSNSPSLNKVLCGLKLETPIPTSVDLPEEDQHLMDGMIKAIIGHWEAIGDSSPEDFRGNWFVRDGQLTEEEERWSLVVEKRSYDILLNRCPYSFSRIHFPWMDKPLHVTWM